MVTGSSTRRYVAERIILEDLCWSDDRDSPFVVT